MLGRIKKTKDMKQFVEDYCGHNFKRVTKGGFNNRGWALFECLDGVGVCEDLRYSEVDRWKYCRVVYAPDTPEALEVLESTKYSVHSAAESWDGRPEFGNDF